jgi:nucleotide-binding universal stress UspA family protein
VTAGEEVRMYRTIVVGTDGSPTARGAVETAIELAKAFGATLHVACGYRPPSQAVVVGAAEAPLGAMPSDDEVRELFEKEVAEQAGAAGDAGVKYEVHLMAGSGAHAVLEVAEAQDADLIVVGNRGMTGVRRMLGSVPNNIAHHASCSVLIVDTC